MLMTLDQWLARFFGASRRADRAAPLAQRASFGLDGVEMRQIDADIEFPAWDEEQESSPYRPYIRRPRSVFAESPRAALAPGQTPEAPEAPPYPAFGFERARLEAEAAEKSRAILAAATRPAQAMEPVQPFQPGPQFQSNVVAESPHEPGAPQFFRPDLPHVRFTRTPEASIARRKAEEEAQRRAAEEEARRAEEEARRRAEDSARRLEEARLAQVHVMNHSMNDAMNDMTNSPKPRVRYTRTPDRVSERKAAAPQPAPEMAPERPEAAVAPAPAFGAFASMGARFSFSVGFGSLSAFVPAPVHEPAPVAAPAPVLAEPAEALAVPASDVLEKPAKMRIRVKAVAAPSEPAPQPVAEPIPIPEPEPEPEPEPAKAAETAKPVKPAEPVRSAEPVRVMKRAKTPVGGFLERLEAANFDYQPFAVETLAPPPHRHEDSEPDDELEVNADALEKTLEDFGVRGDVLNAHPGPVVTLYEFEPAPGIKSSRVIGLSDDIARSMSAVSARVAVV
ncbi:hypothetical protein K9U33_16685, partial [Rhodoblastus acidophilus]